MLYLDIFCVDTMVFPSGLFDRCNLVWLALHVVSETEIEKSSSFLPEPFCVSDVG